MYQWGLGIGLTLLIPVIIGGVQSIFENTAKSSANAAIQTRAELVFPNNASGVYGIVFDNIIKPDPTTKDKVFSYEFTSSNVLHIKSGFITTQRDFDSAGSSQPNWFTLHTRLENGTALTFLQCQCGALRDEKFNDIGVICNVHLPAYTLEQINTGSGTFGNDMEKIIQAARAKPAQ